MYTMMEPTMFISEIFDQVDFSTVMSSSVKISKEKEITLQVIIHIMVDPHGHNDNITTLKSEGNSL